MADHQQFFHACFHQLASFAHHRMGRAADQFPAHIRNDAELALVIAAFRDLQIAVMARGQADAGGRQKVDERIRAGRDCAMYGVQNLLVLMRAGDGQNAGMGAADVILFGAQTAGDDHLAVLVQGFPDRLKAFGLGAIQKSAGVHDHRIRTGIVRADRIAFGTQARQDAFAVDQRLRAAKADHAHSGLTRADGVLEAGLRGKVGTQVGRIYRICHGGPYS